MFKKITIGAACLSLSIWACAPKVTQKTASKNVPAGYSSLQDTAKSANKNTSTDSTNTADTDWRKPLVEYLLPQPSYCNGWFLTQHKFLAPPVSLTTTQGITFVFFSWRYLDVSVHAVRSIILYIQMMTIWFCQTRFPHSDTSGSKLV